MNEYELEPIHQCLCAYRMDFENASLCVFVCFGRKSSWLGLGCAGIVGHCTSEENLLSFLPHFPNSPVLHFTLLYIITDCNYFLYVDFVYSNKYY